MIPDTSARWNRTTLYIHMLRRANTICTSRSLESGDAILESGPNQVSYSRNHTGIIRDNAGDLNRRRRLGRWSSSGGSGASSVVLRVRELPRRTRPPSRRGRTPWGWSVREPPDRAGGLGVRGVWRFMPGKIRNRLMGTAYSIPRPKYDGVPGLPHPRRGGSGEWHIIPSRPTAILQRTRRPPPTEDPREALRARNASSRAGHKRLPSERLELRLRLPYLLSAICARFFPPSGHVRASRRSYSRIDRRVRRRQAPS
jgi:hypothetical protein